MSSSIPETPFLNSVTLLPSDRITLGRRLPKISSETKATTINSVGPRFGRKANGSMVKLLEGQRGDVGGCEESCLSVSRSVGRPSVRPAEHDHAGGDPGRHR